MKSARIIFACAVGFLSLTGASSPEQPIYTAGGLSVAPSLMAFQQSGTGTCTGEEFTNKVNQCIIYQCSGQNRAECANMCVNQTRSQCNVS